jgi:hypothetical protein
VGRGIRGAGACRRVSVTTPGFAESVGHLRFAQTECGVCYIPGTPPVPAPFKGEVAVHHAVSPDTFQMAGIEVLEGRGFTPADGPTAEPVAIVSRGFAAKHFQDGDAIGRRVQIGGAVGAGLGCWASLFVVSGLVPEAYGAPSVLTSTFLKVGGTFVLVAGIVAASGAAWETRGGVRGVG